MEGLLSVCGQIRKTVRDHNFLMGTLYARYKSLHTYEEMIFLFKSAKYFRDKKINAEYVFELRLFMQYLRSKNFVFWKQFFLMSGVWVIGNEIENTKKHNLEAIKTECLLQIIIQSGCRFV